MLTFPGRVLRRMNGGFVVHTRQMPSPVDAQNLPVTIVYTVWLRTAG